MAIQNRANENSLNQVVYWKLSIFLSAITFVSKYLIFNILQNIQNSILNDVIIFNTEYIVADTITYYWYILSC